jgi:lysophospholipase L1-like esterase
MGKQHKGPWKLAIVLSISALCFTVSSTQLIGATGAPAALVNRATIPTEKDLDRHDAFMLRKNHLIETGGTRLVFIGDSITDAWRLDPQREFFEDYFGQYRPYNIGTSGDETQHVLWSIEHGELDGITPTVVVILIGTNNIGNSGMSPDETARGITTLVGTIRKRLTGSKILLLGIFPRGNLPGDPLRLQVNMVNNTIARLDDGQFVKYLDIGDRFLDSYGRLSGTVMPDYLHPNARGYEIWGAAIKPVVDALER